VAAVPLVLVAQRWRSVLAAEQDMDMGLSSGEEDDDEMEEEEGTVSEPLKMVLVVRQDLGMKKGKIAAQCCHAALGAYRRAVLGNATWRAWNKRWITRAQTKVAVKCPDEDSLNLTAAKCMAASVPHYLVTDAGRTQIAPGSKTVCGVGPAPVSVVDSICGQFKLL